MGKRTIILLILLVLVIVVLGLSFKRPPSASGDIVWGVTFSHMFAQELGLDWKETYLAILDELQPKLLRLPVYWNNVEPEEGVLYFADYDFMFKEAAKRNVSVIPVLGKRVPRWPECHVPEWAKTYSKEDQQEGVRRVIFETVERYKHLKAISAWQVENEPFLRYFGICPPLDREAFDREIEFVRFLDPTRPIVVTDSGELSVWLPAAKRADIFGTTMYRIVWSERWSPYLGYITYPLPPKFFWLKANLVHALYGGDKPITVSELQAEPWGPGYLSGLTAEEQGKSMSIEQFHDNIAYAREVGFPEVYLWGVEWWYALKTKHGQSAYWDAARDVIASSGK